MKKLLVLLAVLMALTVVFVACKDDPATPADTTVADTNAATNPVETPTEAPVDETTAAPVDETTAAPEPETTVAPAPAPETTPEPETTEPEPETTADPMKPVNVFEAADISTIVGGDPNNLTQDCVSIVDDYLHIVPIGADPYWYPFSSVDGSRYVAIRYRTDATGADMQLYIASSGNGPTDDTTMIRQTVVADGEWHLIVFDTQSLIEAGKYDGEYVSYFRFDPLEAGYKLDENGEPYKDENNQWARYSLPEGCFIDIEYIAFFHSPEAAEKYDADTHFVVPPHNDQLLVLGVRDGGPFSGAPAKKFGQRGQIGENFLKNVSIEGLATYADGNVNTWSFKVWQWNTDYATTVAGAPLFEKIGENHADNSTFSMNIPAELGIRGDIYYEIEYLSGSGTFTGWTAKDVVLGLETYVEGELKDGGYAASIVVGVALPTKYDNYAPAIDTWTVSGHCAQLVGKEGHANSPMVAAGGVELGALLHQGSIALGEIDLSKYDKVVIYYGVDNSEVTWGRYNENPANRIMLLNADMSMVNSPEESTVIAGATYEPCGWAVQAFEIDLTDVDYNGPVFVTYDTLPGTFMLFSAVEFIGGDIPAAPEKPVNPVEPSWILDAAGMSIAAPLNNASVELKDGYASFTATDGDPWVLLTGNIGEMPEYLAFCYRTNTTQGGEIFLSDGAGPEGGKSFQFNYTANGEWNLMVFHLPTVASYMTSNTVGFIRFDFYTGGAEEAFMDIEYFAFFETEELANEYFAFEHKVVEPETPDEPVVENYNVPMDSWTVSGHAEGLTSKDKEGHGPMVAAGGLDVGALLHQGAVGLGEIDLSKYSKVVVKYGIDNSGVTQGHYDANGTNRIMLSKVDNNMTMAPADADIIASTTYTLQGWALVEIEIDLTAVDYNGPVFLTYDTLPGTFMLIGSVEFIA